MLNRLIDDAEFRKAWLTRAEELLGQERYYELKKALTLEILPELTTHPAVQRIVLHNLR